MVSVMLVNHGESVLAREERYSGQRDTPLTAMGQAQHQRLAARLVGKRIGRVVCSDLERCRALADLIAAGRGIEVETMPGLREAAFGAWEGLTYKEAMERDRASMVAFNRDLVHVAPPGGESLRALAERARPAFDAAVRSHDRHSGALVIVSHGGTIRALLCGLLAIPLERHWTLRIDHASLTKLDLYPLGPILEVLNDTCYLRDG
ncbi:MAG: alpha-ribazole phosphatase [Chloroflexi bacterium]|nr:alpha-ribazole phosphatase [Chloroflexota bacterium]